MSGRDVVLSTTPPQVVALRNLADMLVSWPDGLPRPSIFAYSDRFDIDVSWHLTISCETYDEQKDAARDLIRHLGGRWRKNPNSDRMSFEQNRDGMNLRIDAARDAVCLRVVTGTETVTTEVPAQKAVEAHTLVEEREIVEWICEPVMTGEPVDPNAPQAVTS